MRKKFIWLVIAAVMFVHGLLNIASSGWILMIIGALLFLFLWKSLKEKPKSQKTNSVGEDLSHLTPEGELPFGWMAYNQEIIGQMEAELAIFRKAIHDADNLLTKHSALKSYFLYLDDGKKHYTEINECAGKYFEEYICNSEETKSNMRRFIEIERQLDYR